MINKDLERFIAAKCPFEMTNGQREVVAVWAGFLLSADAGAACLLRGYAGTGKTSLLAALVRAMDALGRKVVLLAPTGRAAKVLALHAGHAAFTIHKRIYRQKAFSADTDNFLPDVNLMKHTLFIVDEASMIAGRGGGFGAGSLLDDLVRYVYSGAGCRLLLVGDAAQLPPVGEELSPALSRGELEACGLRLWEVELTEVVRQQASGGILWNATRLRRLLAEGAGGWPRVRFTGFPDICRLPGDELIEAIEEAYSRCGTDQTIVVTRSNKRANVYNNGIRGAHPRPRGGADGRRPSHGGQEQLFLGRGARGACFGLPGQRRHGRGAPRQALSRALRFPLCRRPLALPRLRRCRTRGHRPARHPAERGAGPDPRAGRPPLPCRGGGLCRRDGEARADEENQGRPSLQRPCR